MIPDVLANFLITVQYSTVQAGADLYGPAPSLAYGMVWYGMRRYIGTALSGALYSLSYLLFVVCM